MMQLRSSSTVWQLRFRSSSSRAWRKAVGVRTRLRSWPVLSQYSADLRRLARQPSHSGQRLLCARRTERIRIGKTDPVLRQALSAESPANRSQTGIGSTQGQSARSRDKASAPGRCSKQGTSLLRVKNRDYIARNLDAASYCFPCAPKPRRCACRKWPNNGEVARPAANSSRHDARY